MNVHGSSVLALIAFELRRRMGEPATLIAGVALLGVLVIGHVEYWSALPPRPSDDRMFGYGYIAAILAVLRFGLGEDRRLGLGEYLTVNLVSPARYLAARLLTGGIIVVCVGAAACLLALLLSGFEWVYAVWYTLLFTLVAGMFLPFVLLVELIVETRFAGLVVFIGFIIALMVLEPFFGVRQVTAWLGLEVSRFAFGSLGPLALRAGLAAAVLATVVVAAALRDRGRAGVARG